MTQSLLGRKSIFLTLNGINGSLANPRRAPILQTKFVTKKQMNKNAWQKYNIWTGFEPGML